MFKELNKVVNTVREDVSTEEMEFKKLREFIGQEVKVDGFFFNDGGNFGRQLVVVGNGYKINMPKRAVEQFEKIATNTDMLKAVLEGHLKLTNIATKATKSGIAVIYDLEDC